MERSTAQLHRFLQREQPESEGELEALLDGLIGGVGPDAPPATPLEEAQDLMYEAWGARGRRRVDLALRALKISEDCADAYVLLAEETARSVEERMLLFLEGVRAGERGLGPEGFEERVGGFWGLVETRPYMRARAGLGACLWSLGERGEAIAHFQDMLRLNPGDNQGLRSSLANWLLEEGRDAELAELLEAYADDVGADMAYPRALHRFRREGPSKAAEEALAEALEYNPFVPDYLLGRRRLPKRQPEFLGMGDAREAAAYVANSGALWRATEGALEWLAAQWEGGAGPGG